MSQYKDGFWGSMPVEMITGLDFGQEHGCQYVSSPLFPQPEMAPHTYSAPSWRNLCVQVHFLIQTMVLCSIRIISQKREKMQAALPEAIAQCPSALAPLPGLSLNM